jgi:hypothetical protein
MILSILTESVPLVIGIESWFLSIEFKSICSYVFSDPKDILCSMDTTGFILKELLDELIPRPRGLKEFPVEIIT